MPRRPFAGWEPGAEDVDPYAPGPALCPCGQMTASRCRLDPECGEAAWLTEDEGADDE